MAGDTEKDRHGVNVFRKFTTACILEEPHTPLYPAGFGLGYAAFEYGQVSVNKTALRDEADVLQVSFTLTNIGDRAGTEVAQLYLRDPVGEASRPVRELKGFERVELAAGATRKVTFRVTTEQLAYYRGQTLSDCVHDWESGDFDIMVGPNCEDVQVVRVNWRK
ncbi:thermostable beta-glucosidase B [mine drainage metagenome]|uniref:Thermostable beta-glucosidase B n=1 Tax=mine drainage metagenome TaxID=410659 RepID=A0A1J5Q3E7_9ZZZZ